jgi:hypothetical protein
MARFALRNRFKLITARWTATLSLTFCSDDMATHSNHVMYPTTHLWPKHFQTSGAAMALIPPPEINIPAASVCELLIPTGRFS